MRNMLQECFTVRTPDEILISRFVVMTSGQLDLELFIRDRLELLVVEDLSAVLDARAVMDILNGQAVLEDYAGNGRIMDEPDLDLDAAEDYLLVKSESGILGVVDLKAHRRSMRLIGHEVSQLVSEILDTSHDAICVVDEHKQVLHWNRKAEAIYSIPASQLLGQPVTDFFPKALLPVVIDQERPYEDVFNNPRGEFKSIIAARPLYHKGRLVGGVSCDKDITEMVEDAAKLNVGQRTTQGDPIYRSTFSDLIGEDLRFRETVEFARRISDSSINVLITGESGTGKEVFAQSIHNASGRSGSFVPVNCSAIPKDLIESELFGYERGTFTGALNEGKIGKFELANNGTVLLDEIGDLPLSMQPKILRILEDGIFYRVGGNTAVKVDVRIVAATNSDLRQMMEKGLFRKDLFFRLNSVHIDLPPLRERKRDIPLLIEQFLREFTLRYMMAPIEMPRDMVESLTRLKWEGNIRELRNIIERYVIMSKNGIAEPDLPVLRAFESPDDVEPVQMDLSKQIAQFEKRWIRKVLAGVDGNQSRAAQLLNIPRTTLIYKMKKHGLDVK